MAKKQRLTERLNLALAEASAATSMGARSPEQAQKACQLASEAIDKAQEIMGEIMRAAESI